MAMEAAGHKKPFHMSDTQIKLPHEDGFGGQFNPYIAGSICHERADDQALRYQWLQDALVLSTPFRPSGRVKGMTGQSANEIPGRQMLPEIVDRLDCHRGGLGGVLVPGVLDGRRAPRAALRAVDARL